MGGVRATLIGPSGVVDITDAEEEYGPIAAGGCSDTAEFNMIVADCTGSAFAAFAVYLEYAIDGFEYCQVIFFNHTFPEECVIDFEVCSYTVAVDPPYDCNGDGVLQSGERAEIRAAIRNIGDSTAINPDVWLACIDNLELDCDANESIPYPDLPPDGSCHWPEDSDDHWDVAAPKNVSGVFETNPWIEFNGGGPSPIPDPDRVSFTVGTQGWLDVDPNDYYFTAELNTCIAVPIQIRNHGTAGLTVTGVHMNGPLPPQVVSVTPGQNFPWQVGDGQFLEETLNVCTSDVRGTIDPGFQVVFETSACYEQDEDRIEITGSVGTIPIHPVPNVVPSVGSGGEVDVHGDLLVWHDERNGNTDVFVYDIESLVELQITSDPKGQFLPRISERLIAWNDRRHWDGVSDSDTSGLDIYMYDRATRVECAVTTDPAHERLVGVHGNMIAFVRAYHVFDESSCCDIARNLLVYQYRGNCSFDVIYDSGFASNANHQPMQEFSDHGDFGGGLLVVRRREFFWNTEQINDQWEPRDDHIEVIDFAAGETLPRRVCAGANSFSAAVGKFAYAHNDANNLQIWLWRRPDSCVQLTTTENARHGRDALAASDRFIVYDKTLSGLPSELYYWDLLLDEEFKLAGMRSEDCRMDATVAVWTSSQNGSHIYFASLPCGECNTGDDCNDSDTCTTDTCNNGCCKHIPVCTSDGDCDDGLFCNGTETCDVNGCCQDGTPPSCDDEVDCTEDSCEEETGACVHRPRESMCDDEAFCNGLETCSLSGCVSGTDIDCSHLDDSCNVGTCDNPAEECRKQPSNEAGDCDDGRACTGDDVCAGGVCSGTRKDCSDLNDQCNIGGCDDVSGDCVANPFLDGVGCDDGQACNTRETCQAGACMGGSPVTCSDPDPNDCVYPVCDAAGSEGNCDGSANEPEGTDCEDGAFCNGAEMCDASGTCQTGTPPVIDDGVTCTKDSCDEASDVVVNTPNDANCDDGAFCNGAETCDTAEGCQPGSVPCTDPAFPDCDEETDECIGRCPCVYNFDDRCSVAGGDLGMFAGCWGCCRSDACWVTNACAIKDFDCNGCVAGGDLGWFAGAWLKDCSELDPLSYPRCRQCDGPIVCPWPDARNRSSSTTASADPQRRNEAQGVVELALRLTTDQTRRSELDRLSHVRPRAVEAGERVYAEFWVRDDSPSSHGLTAVFADLLYDPLQFDIISIDPGETFTLFAEADMEADAGVVRRVGGATMEENRGAGVWTRVSVVELRALVDVAKPAMTLRPSQGEAVSRRGQGLVPTDQIRVVPSNDGKKPRGRRDAMRSRAGGDELGR